MKKYKYKKYLDFYYRYILIGEIPKNGLCNCFGTSYDETTWVPHEYPDENLRFFFPEKRVVEYWAVGEDYKGDREHRVFTKLRQNIVLLMAAMNGEL